VSSRKKDVKTSLAVSETVTGESFEAGDLLFEKEI